MKFIECPQGTDEWFAARCGKITASCFADAISTVGALTTQQTLYVAGVRAGVPEKVAAEKAGYKAVPNSDIIRRALAGEDTCEPSDTAKRYAADLAIERISGQPHGEPPKAWVLERGHEMEAHARRFYEGRTGAYVTEAGICLTDDEHFGYSTDGLVDDDGLIEIKAPMDSTKILAVWATGDTSEYDHQMQGGMWITGRQWCDFIMYVPDLACIGKDLYVKRVFRDEAFIADMVARLAKFDALVDECEAIFRGPQAGTLVDAEFDPDFQEVAAAPAPAMAAAQADADHARIELASVQAELLGADAPVGHPAFDMMLDGLQRKREADAQVQTEPQNIPEIIPEPAPAAQVTPIAAARPVAPTTTPALRLGQINERLAPISLTADGLAALGFAPAETIKSAKLYHESSFPHICAAVMRHIAEVKEQHERQAA